MPSKKKKYNARFPAGRIKKIMQTDEEVGKVAQAVPIIISRTLELFVESLLTKSMQITQARNAKTLTPSHMKQCIQSESRFDFLKDLVKNIPDASIQEDNENNAIFEATYIRGSEKDAGRDAPQDSGPSSTDPYQPFPPPLSRPPHPPFFDQSPSSSRTPVIQYVPKVSPPPTEQQKLHVKIDSRQLPVPQLRPVSKTMGGEAPAQIAPADTVPPLVPIAGVAGVYQGAGDSLCIDEDYDN